MGFACLNCGASNDLEWDIYCAQCQIPLVSFGDKYQVERKLGGGAFGAVFLARDHSSAIPRHVALKIFDFGVGAIPAENVKDFERRLLRRAEAMGSQSKASPYLTEIYDCGSHPLIGPFYAMEYVEGETLYSFLKERSFAPMALEQALPLIAQACDAVEALHQEGIIHRDLKPGNIMLLESAGARSVKINNFGSIKAVIKACMSAEQPMDLGTPLYKAPEQFDIDQAITAATDIYALASILYLMLTGVRSHAEQARQGLSALLLAKVQTPPPTIRERRPDLSFPDAVVDAIAKGLSISAVDRFQSIGEFRAAFDGLLELADEPPRKPESPEEISLRIEFLQEIPLLEQMHPEELGELCSILLLKEYAANELVTSEGTMGTAFYIVWQGEVILCHKGKNLSTLRRGDFFGEEGFLHGDTPRLYTTIVTKPSRLLTLERASLTAHLQRHPSAAMKLLWGVAKGQHRRLADVLEAAG